MQGHSHLQLAADASCLASARGWRKEAEHLRDNAEAAYLTAGQRATLLREAEAAERRAVWGHRPMQQHGSRAAWVKEHFKEAGQLPNPTSARATPPRRAPTGASWVAT